MPDRQRRSKRHPATRSVRAALQDARVLSGVALCALAAAFLLSGSRGLAATILLAPFVVIGVHESGHVAAGALMGIRVVRVRIGVGPALHFVVRSVRIRIGVIPCGGSVRPADGQVPSVPELVVFALGGAFANLLFAVLVELVATFRQSNSVFLHLLAFSSMLVGIVNLVPFESDRYGLLMSTDLFEVLQAVRED